MNIKAIFANSGPFAEALTGYQPREEQIALAQAVADAITEKQVLLGEAGTGTGKTFAYLVPALIADKKVIVSTGSKNLQDQLFFRDLPKVQEVLDHTIKTALLKGRANYLCLYRLALYKKQAVSLDPKIASDFRKVEQFAQYTKTGDLTEIPNLEEYSGVYPYVTSTTDNCLGKECPHFSDCYVAKSRRNAMDAQLVVVNHHLFFADLALKDTGFGELIPETDVVIFDEAHQIPDIACQFFGQSISTKQIRALCDDVEAQYHSQFKDVAQLLKASDKLNLSCQDLRLAFGPKLTRGDWKNVINNTDLQQELTKTQDHLSFLVSVLKELAPRNQEAEALYERGLDLNAILQHMLNTSAGEYCFWYETTKQHLIMHQTPLSVADKFSAIIKETHRSWVFTSATLAVDGGFEHFKQDLGLTDVQELIVDSPFDYAQQALFCVPRYLPEPSDHRMINYLLELIIPLIDSSQGRCFLLFTSYRMLNLVANGLQEQDSVKQTLLVQGQKNKRLLLEEFCETPNAVLLGTQSFWEGVDVRGNDLICVLIDKLPFMAPDDPVLNARVVAVKKQGKDPFAVLQIPKTVITLKQGVGRLIRDHQDRGALIICDNRLVTKDYAETFINSLPKMKRTRDIQQVYQFLKQLSS